ncbi:UNVERIFIED_CONTAM: hypothetical protein FKN15_006090 [Acipenser sinensis]
MTSDSSVKTVFCMHMSFCVFPVEVHIKKPLQPIHLSSEQVALEVLSLCCQLDLLIRAQVHQQVISSFKGVLPLSVLKRDIEANFKALKTSLVKEDASQQEPQLPAHYVSWILSVTRSVTASVSALPDELIEDLTPAMSFVMNLT